MRYALRNKEKIVAALGGGYLQTLIKSLDTRFRSDLPLLEYIDSKDKSNQSFIDVPGETPGKVYVFAVISIKFDVYRLAFYKELDNG